MQVSKVCKRCGRKLKTDTAKEIGMGKICFEKSKASALKSLFERSVPDAERSTSVQE